MSCSSQHSLAPVHKSQMDDEATDNETHCPRACLCRMCVWPIDSEVLCVAMDTFWRDRTDLCMHSLVQPQTHLPIHRSIFVYTSSRSVFEALDQRCDGHGGLGHVILTFQSARYVSSLPKQLVNLVWKILVNSWIPSGARKFWEQLTRLQGEESTCPAEDDDQADGPL